MKLTDELKALRAEIPIGVSAGLKLLQAHAGNVKQAKAAFHIQQIENICQKTACEKEQAEEKIAEYGYDLEVILKSFEEERLSLSQRILSKHTSDEIRLSVLADLVERDKKLIRETWIQKESIDTLAPVLSKFMTLNEWLNYEEWEGYLYAISHPYVGEIIEILRNDLNMKNLSDSLAICQGLHKKLAGENSPNTSAERHANFRVYAGNMGKEKAFVEAEESFRKQKDELLAATIAFVEKHIALFP